MGERSCLHRHQLRELVVGLQTAQQPAEFVVVCVLAQPLVRPQDLTRAHDQPLQVSVALNRRIRSGLRIAH